MAGTGTLAIPTRGERALLLAIVLVALAWSGVAPVDRLTWVLEVMWVAAGVPLVWWAWRRFPLTRLLCWLLALHAVVLVYGGHYTYAETPLGDWGAAAGWCTWCWRPACRSARSSNSSNGGRP